MRTQDILFTHPTTTISWASKNAVGHGIFTISTAADLMSINYQPHFKPEMLLKNIRKILCPEKNGGKIFQNFGLPFSKTSSTYKLTSTSWERPSLHEAWAHLAGPIQLLGIVMQETPVWMGRSWMMSQSYPNKNPKYTRKSQDSKDGLWNFGHFFQNVAI